MPEGDQMGSRNNYALESFIKTLRSKIAGFRGLDEKQQVTLARLIWEEGTWRREHRHEEGAMSISYLELEKSFGRGGFAAINSALNIFEVSPNWHWQQGHNKARNATRTYRLTDAVREVKEQYLKPGREKMTRLITEDAKVMRTLPEPIDSKGLDGVTASAWRGAKMHKAVPVDMALLKEIYQHLERMLEPEALAQKSVFRNADVEVLAEDIKYRRDITGQLIRLAQTDIAGRGCIMHRYAEAKTGRLYAHGVSLQTAPRLIRKAALHGQYDYDIENCHFSIFAQLADRYSYQTGSINHYLKHKKEIREGIAARVGISKDQAKMCLLALMFGARLSDWEDNAIPSAIGQDRARLLFNDPDFAGIANDVLVGRDAILKGWPKRRTTLVNDMNKAVRLKETPGVRLSHIIQGIEAKALKAAISLYPDEIVLLMHDGFVSTRAVDARLIERKMLEETGYRLELSGGVIALPADLEFS